MEVLLIGATIAGLLLIVIGAAHSLLGERLIIGPLEATGTWDSPVRRTAALRILRYAWHATTLAWVALALIIWGLPAAPVVAVLSSVSAVLLFAMVPSHFAWPLFLIAGLGAGWAAGIVGPPAARIAAIAGAVMLGLLSVLHLYWATGGSRGANDALPTSADGHPVLSPGALATTTVAVLLAGLAGLLALRLAGRGGVGVSIAVASGAVVLALRAIGDGKYAGFTKKIRRTTFSHLDDVAFTPLVVVLSIAVGAGLLT